jgi:hypothetical protein
MKATYLMLLGLLFATASFAQGELLSPEEMDKQPNYYLVNVEDAFTPNDNGEVKLYFYTYEDGKFSKEETWAKPDDVYQLYVLPYDNDATRFPKEVFLFKNLQVLVLGMWEFTEIPDTAPGNLPNLQYLDLQNTKITSLPKGVAGWEHMDYLNLMGTEVGDKEKARIKETLPRIQMF